MELYHEILLHHLEKGTLDLPAERLVDMTSYQTLKKSRPSSKMTALMILLAFTELKRSFARWKKSAATAGIDTISDKYRHLMVSLEAPAAQRSAGAKCIS